MNKNYDNATSNLLKIREIRANLFYILVRKRDHKIFAVIIKDIKKVFKSKSYIDPQSFVLEEYYDLIDIFKKKFADKLPPYRDKYDFKIEFESSGIPKFNLLYDISREELLVIRQYLNKYLIKGFICLSRSSFISSVLFVKKFRKDLRFYVNYRALNIIIIRNRYPISLL